jgi:hypothetical protein
MTRTKHNFTLKGIHITNVLCSVYTRREKGIREYGEEEDPQTIIDCDIDTTVTPVSELLQEKSALCRFFLTQQKIRQKWWIPCLCENGETLPSKTNIPCWWDRHTFSTHPIGCPLFYNAKKNIMFTEGVFCSFPCIKAYILDRPRDERYAESISLLMIIVARLYGKVIDIPIAGSWKHICDRGGGPHSIIQYRDTFGRLEYTETCNKRIPLMVDCPTYIQERRSNVLREKDS